ncbi:hypothetical protein FRB99_006539 [Tulasnella sp. 403]|nr:hypothetical protein FRB99_006539 [Tulasnella sp. 403]
MARVGIVPAVIATVIPSGLATLLIVWVLSHQYHDPGGGRISSGGSFILYEGSEARDDGTGEITASLVALTFSSLSSQIISLMTPFVMALAAYRAAGLWLRNSSGRSGFGPDENPTPTQFGLLIPLLGFTNLKAIKTSLLYLLQPSTRRARVPRLFTETLVTAVVVIALSHIVGIADLWLHSTTKSLIVNQLMQMASDPTENHAVAFNSTLCDQWNTSSWPCLNTQDGWAVENSSVVFQGWETARNLSNAALQVFTLSDWGDMAVLVPTAAAPEWMGSKLTYNSSTFGARADCQILNWVDQTNRLGSMSFNPDWPVPVVMHNSRAVTPSMNSSLTCNGTPEETGLVSNGVLGLVNGVVGGATDGVADFPENAAVSPNPAKVMVQLQWQVLGVLGYFRKRGSGPPLAIWETLFAGCSLEFFNASIEYVPATNSYNLLNATPSTPELTSILWSPLLTQFVTDQLALSIQGVTKVGSQGNITARLNQELGRLALGSAGGLFQAAPSSELATLSTVVLGRYPMAPFLCLVAALYAYALVAMVLFAVSRWSWSYSIRVPSDTESKGKEISSLVLAQTWLTDPMPLVAFASRTGREDERMLSERVLDMASDEEGERLRIGLLDSDGQVTFGIEKDLGSGGADRSCSR